MRRGALPVGALALLALAGGWRLGSEDRPRREPPGPRQVEARGKLVCLAEELRDAHRAAVPPVHDHVLALRSDGAAGEPPQYLAVLRTSQSQALFTDDRFRKRTLVLTGRVFPGTSHLEVSRFQWLEGEQLRDVYYWCEVCSIRGVDPGPCSCCQGTVELREAPAAPPPAPPKEGEGR